MIVLDLKDFRPREIMEPTVLCLGNFDGVHLGHQALLREAQVLAKRLAPDYPGIRVGVFCFAVPPKSFLSSEPPALITGLREKLMLLRHYGVEVAFLGDFPCLRDLSPERFVRQVLEERCGCVATVCGFNFRFGKDGAGGSLVLSRFYGERAVTVPEVTRLGGTVSSTRIRTLLEAGRVEQAAELSGHPFCLTSPVVHGKALGRTLGFPTANQFFPKSHVIPGFGVYATRTFVDGVSYPSVTNVGKRPTVQDGLGINCETHLLDFNGELYHKLITVSFCRKLRDEMRFESLAALRQAVDGDRMAARTFFETAGQQEV